MRRSGSSLAATLLALFALLFARGAAAHAVGVSRAQWEVDGARVVAEIALARSELAATSLDTRAVVAGIAVTGDGAACAGALDDARDAENDGAIVRATWTCATVPKRVAIEARVLGSLSQGHRMIARVLVGGAPVKDDVLYASHDRVEVDASMATPASGAPAASPPARETPGLLAFVRMGVEHILTGYDHLLFLFGLVLVGGRARSLVGVVTAFTFAHSITLAVAALGLWTPSPRIVEPAIALSIAYVGVENFFVRDASKRWRITLPFGLVHGFGFAGALREIELPRADVPAALVGFNAGVELGQLAVLAAVLPLLALARKRAWLDVRGVRAASGAIVAMGLAWFVARVVA
jgi:hydrogenase/urease accessory protein HupE